MGGGEAAMQIWAVGTLRNEADIIRVNVLHHLSEGIDRFLLLDNGSSDATREILRDLSQYLPIEWEEATGRFHQQELLTRLARSAARRGADWILPIDADEFWCAPGSGIRQVLSGTDAGALQVEVVNFVQRRDVARASAAALLHMVRRAATPLGHPDDIANLVETNRTAYVQIRYPSKWIVRASSDLIVGWGNHDVAGTIGRREPTSEVICLHTPLRAQQVLAQKTELSRPGDELSDYLSKAWHIRRWRRLAEAGTLDDEWQANSHIDGVLDVYGHRHELIEDTRLRDCLAPWIGPNGSDGRASGVTWDASTRARIVEAAEQIDGWFAPEELSLLVDVVARVVRSYGSRANVVEIGSYQGRSTIALAATVRRLGEAGNVFAIDPHRGDVGARDSTVGLEQREPTLEALHRNLERHRLADVVRVIQGRSTDVEWRDAVHLLLVDGLHDYESVMDDVSHFEPWLARGAYVALHDASDEFPGVRACIRAMLDTHAYVVRARQTSLVVLQRVGEARPLSAAPGTGTRLEARLGVLDETVATLRQRLARANGELRHCRESLAASEAALARAVESIEALERARRELLQSRSWRWTALLRAAARMLTGR